MCHSVLGQYSEPHMTPGGLVSTLIAVLQSLLFECEYMQEIEQDFTIKYYDQCSPEKITFFFSIFLPAYLKIKKKTEISVLFLFFHSVAILLLCVHKRV